MNSDDLALFRLVAAAGSVSAAAVQGGLDASTLSRRIGQLEKTVGSRLFVRSGRGMKLTEQGEVLLVYSNQMGALLDAAQAALRSPEAGPARIHIGAQPTIAKVLFGQLFHAIRARYPATHIRFTEGLADRLLAELQAGEIDIAVMYRPPYPGAQAYEPLLFERLYLLTPADSDLTPERLRERGLAGVPLVLPSTRHGLRVLVQAIAAKRHQVPRIAVESDSSVALTVDLVRQGCGCTVLPMAAARAEIEAGTLRALPLEGDEGERCIALVMGRTLTPVADLWNLNALIRATAATLVGTPAWPGTRSAA